MRGTNTLNRNEECLLISRLDTAQEGIRESEDRSMKWGKKKKKDDKAKWRISELWENFKRCNICISGLSEGEKRRKQKK